MLWLDTNTILGLGASGRTLIGYENYQKIRATQTGNENYLRIRFTDGLTYTENDISGYASSRLVATKIHII